MLGFCYLVVLPDVSSEKARSLNPAYAILFSLGNRAGDRPANVKTNDPGPTSKRENKRPGIVRRRGGRIKFMAPELSKEEEIISPQI